MPTENQKYALNVPHSEHTTTTRYIHKILCLTRAIMLRRDLITGADHVKYIFFFSFINSYCCIKIFILLRLQLKRKKNDDLKVTLWCFWIYSAARSKERSRVVSFDECRIILICEGDKTMHSGSKGLSQQER